ncbi:Dna polymerase v family [Thalictrum thalictroides]|uniref:Dna polymerase v family n=1 Tax=Thalictrum thalictroides TaxID=46969 RepID=A0A7J6XB06_THATH|nr:Dna polymerase v family [Thalictrum thalictroides]
MGSKKRSPSSSSEDELEDEVEIPIDNVPSKPLKKPKTVKTDEEIDDIGVLPNSDKPMERRKKRKALDKGRHKSSSENVGKPKAIEDVVKEPLVSSSGSLPEFDIGVFRDLVSADSLAREAAALKLVMNLQEVQTAYEKCDKKDAGEGGLQLEAEKDDGLKNCAPSVRYAIRRLIRGVSSSRECARQGFAMGLTILVGTIPSLKVDSVMKLIVDILEVTSSMKGQEARDCLLGRLFAYGALARSGRIAEEWMADNTNPYVKEFTSLVISLAVKKRYLQEPAVTVILNLIEKLPVEALLSQVLEAPGMHDWFQKATDVGNPDALLLALKMREKISGDTEIFRKLLPYPFSPNKMFASDHLSKLIPCFKESTFCQPRVHSMWPVLINILLPDVARQEDDTVLGLVSNKKHKKSRKYNSSEEEIAKNLRSFCEIVIEGSLLLSSHDRKHLAFNVLLLLLPRLPPSCVQIVLSHRLMQGLMDILSTKDSRLYKVAQHFLKELSNWVGKDDDRRVAVIVALQKHSSGKFDCITHTRLVKDLMAEFNTGSGCMLFVQNLVSMFVEEGHEAEEPSDQSQTMDDSSEIGSVEDKDSGGTSGTPDFLKGWVIDSLPRVLKYPKLDMEAKFMVQKEIMKFLAVQGLFSASLGTEVTSFELQEKFKWPKAATSSALRRMCVEQLQLLLANAQKGEGSHSVSIGLDLNDLGSYFMRFLSTLCNIPSVSLFRPLNNDDEIAFKKLQAMEAQLSREERNTAPGKNANRVHAMRCLLIQLMLQVLLRPGEFSESASELVLCCKKAFSSPDLLDESGNDDDDDVLDDGGMPKLMDVLVDTLLSLLPQSSAPLNLAVEQVFKSFSNDITDTGLLQMLRVIRKDIKPPRHQATDSEDDDDDDEDLLGIEEAEETDEADAVEIGDNDEEADDSEVIAGVDAIGDEVPEGSDESDGGMDDEAMFRMDSYLVRIFRERKNQAGGETAHAQLVLFKLRVLSLVEIFLHENPGKPQVLTVYSYLAKAFVNPQTAESSEQLAQRIWGILQKKIFKAKEYPKGGDIQLSTLESLLEKNLNLASKPFSKRKSAANPSNKKQSANLTRYKMIASLAQTSTHWLLKIIHSKDYPEPQLSGVLDVFGRVLIKYFDSKKSQLKPGFVKEVFRRQPWVGHLLFGFLIEKCGSAKSEVRLVKALDPVEEILKYSLSGKGDGENKAMPLKFLKAHLPSLSGLIGKLVINWPEKQSRRAHVRRFCGQTLKLVTKLHLTKEFLKVLKQDAYNACEAKLGDLFIPFKKPE